MFFRDDADLDELGIGEEEQRHEIGARLLNRRVVFAEREVGIALQPLDRPGPTPCPITSCRFVVNSPGERAPLFATLPHLGRQANSVRNSGSMDLS